MTSLSYQIVKQLADAGFSQEFKDRQNNFYKFGIKGINKIYCPTNKQINQMIFQGAYVYKIPTLSEIMEACNADIYTIERTGRWVFIKAHEHHDLKKIIGKEVQAKTIEEAVAKLWLLLNKK